MSILASALVWIREVIKKMIGSASIKNALQVDISISSEMTNALTLWSQMYEVVSGTVKIIRFLAV